MPVLDSWHLDNTLYTQLTCLIGHAPTKPSGIQSFLIDAPKKMPFYFCRKFPRCRVLENTVYRRRCGSVWPRWQILILKRKIGLKYNKSRYICCRHYVIKIFTLKNGIIFIEVFKVCTQYNRSLYQIFWLDSKCTMEGNKLKPIS